MPGSGAIAEPGLAAVTPGSGEIIAAPVSVCHHVSTMGVRLPPIASRYQRHASGLIFSPTLPPADTMSGGGTFRVVVGRPMGWPATPLRE